MATLKQTRAAELISENLRKGNHRTAQSILKEAGYSDSMAKSSTLVTQSKNFVALLEAQGITDLKLTRCLKRGLSTKTNVQTMHRFMETALKIKGHLKESNQDGLGSLVDFIQNLKDFNIEMLIAIKTRINTDKETENVTPRDS